MHLARAKEIAHRLHSVEQDGIDELQRRILFECLIKQLFQRQLACALTDRFFSVDDPVLQFVFDGQSLDMRSRRGLGFAFCSREMLHVNLQRIAGGFVAINKFACKFNFFLRNFVQRIDFGVIHDGHVKAMVYRFVHENAVQHTSRIHVQAERNIADTENGLDFRKLLLDALYGVQSLNSRGAIFLLAS